MNPFEIPPVGPSARTTDPTAGQPTVAIPATAGDAAIEVPSVDDRVASIRATPLGARRQRRLAAAAGAAAATLLVIGCAAGASTFGAAASSTSSASASSVASVASESSVTTPDPASTVSAASTIGDVPTDDAATDDAATDDAATDGTTDAATDDMEDALGEQDDSQGYGDTGQPEVPQPPAEDGPGDVEPGDVDLDPVDVPVDPCTTLAPGASLLVTPDPLILPADRATGVVEITNCSDGDVAWTAATKPSITLDTAGDDLLPGERVQLGFGIDLDAWDPGAIEFKIKISEPGANHYVDVHAYDTRFGIETAAGNGGLSAGDGVGGCSNACLTGVWLTPNATTPDPTLHVTTDTPARIRVWVSANAPQMSGGTPGYEGTPIATSPIEVRALDTVLQPLAAGQRYHVLVTATDADGEVSWFTDDFVASTPAAHDGGLASPDGPGGCGAQCITSAIVSPDGDTSHLAVASHTPARFQVSVGTNEPVAGTHGPGIPDAEFWANSGEQYSDRWDVDLVDLAPDTSFHIVVLATDVEGRVSAQAGTFRTPAVESHGTVIGLHRIEVTYDGDKNWNRGEVSYAWGFEGLTVATWGERKVRDGDTFTPDSGNRWTIVGHGDVLPTVYVSTAERDADGLIEFCTAGTGVALEPGHSGSCDLSYNVASITLTEDGLADLPLCSELGVVGVAEHARCARIDSTFGRGFDTEFTAIVSFDTF